MEKKQLESLHIHSFRGIRDLELTDLGQINLFVGVNNCGKTSVLEAISLYCNPLNLREWYTISRQRDRESIFLNRTPLLDSLTWLFPQGNLVKPLDSPDIKITSSGNFSVKKIEANYEFIEGIVTGNKTDGRIINNQKYNLEIDEIQNGISITINMISEEGETITNFQLWEKNRITSIDRSKGNQIPYIMITPSSHRTEAFAARLLTEARREGFKSELIKLLQGLDNNIQDLEILVSESKFTRSNSTIFVLHDRFGLAPLSSFGDGVRRLIFIALQLIKLKDGILLIDEIETAIHTEALQNSFSWIVTWCKELNIQLFATTHSLEAVDGILEATDSDTDLVLYRLEQKETKTDVVRIGRDRLQRLRENLGQEVRW